MEHQETKLNSRKRKYAVKQTRKFVRRFLRGFGSGLVLYSGFRTITALTKNPFIRGLPLIPGQVFSVDCLRFASFLGLYPSVYHLTVSLLKKYRDKRDGWNYGLGGGIAGLTFIVEGDNRRTLIALFAVARALGAGIATLVTRGYLQKVPFSETMAFCVCCSFLVHCVAFRPDLLTKGYYNSVLKWSRDYTDKTLNVLFRQPADTFTSCQEAGLHKESCTRHALWDLLCSIPVFAKLYLPIHLTPILVFRWNLILEKPKVVVRSLLRNLLMSSAFLSSMVMIAKYSLCLQRNALRQPPPLPSFIPLVAGLLCGLSLLLERENRRKELALFVIPHSLHALYKMEARSRVKILSRIPKGCVILFSLSMMVLMHAFEREPESLTPLINGLLKFFVGKRKSSHE